MVKNYLIVAVRNMMRHKGYSAINIAGLALGMTCCILVLLFVQDEFKYDAFHDHSDRIYRIVTETQSRGSDKTVRAGSSGAFASTLPESFPEVEEAIRIWMHFQDHWFRVGEKVAMEKICLADPDILDFSSFARQYQNCSGRTLYCGAFRIYGA